MKTARALIAASALSLMLMPVLPASAITPASENGWAHFTECLSAMFSNPTAHAAECSPFPGAPSNNSLSDTAPAEPCIPYQVNWMMEEGQLIFVAGVPCEEEDFNPGA